MTSLHQKIKDTQKSVRILSRGCENAKIKVSILTTLLGELSTKTTGTGVMISDTLIQQTIKKFIKNNEETMGCTFDQGILHRLTVENNCLNEFLPKQLTEGELRAKIKLLCATDEVCSMGSIMAELKSQYGGQYDGKLASQIVKEEM